MGVSDLPRGPTVSRVLAYLKAITRVALATPMHMLAMHNRPDRSWSATVRNRARPLLIDDVNVPSSATSEYRFKKFSRGTLTMLKLRRALSTPLRLILYPISAIVTPGIGRS